MHFHVFISLHRSAVVKVFYIETGESRIGGGDCAVEEQFDSDETGALCGGGSRIVKAVAAGTIAHSVGLGFVWSDGGFLFAVSDFATRRDFMAWDEENGISTTDASADALC